MVIYKTTCLIDGKIYIGQCINDRPSYLGSGTLLKYAIKKYGKENFKKEILKLGVKNQKKLDLLEEIYIKKFNTTDRKIGLNIAPGTVNKFGRGNPSQIPEVKAKIAATSKGRKHSKETKKKMSEWQKGEGNHRFGKSMDEEIKLQISKKLKKLHSTPEAREIQALKVRGIKRSEETRLKMSEAAKRRWKKIV